MSSFSHPVPFAFVCFDDSGPLWAPPSVLSVGFRRFSPPPTPVISPKSYALAHTCRHFIYPIYVVLLRCCSRYPVPTSPPIYPNPPISFALLYFLVIFALSNTPVAQTKSLYRYSQVLCELSLLILVCIVLSRELRFGSCQSQSVYIR